MSEPRIRKRFLNIVTNEIPIDGDTRVFSVNDVATLLVKIDEYRSKFPETERTTSRYVTLPKGLM